MIAATDFDRNRLRLISTALVALALASLVLLAWREVQVRRTVYADIVAERGTASAREIQAFFGPLERQLGTIRGWGVEGDLETLTQPALDARFGPILVAQSTLAALHLGGDEGLEYELEAGAAGLQSRFVRSGGTGQREAEWYRRAAADPGGLVHWYAATDLADSTKATLTGSVGWISPAPRRLTRAAALEISPAAMDSLVTSLGLTENGMLAVVSGDGTAAWATPDLGARFHPANAGWLLYPVDPPVRLLAQALFATSREPDSDRASRRFRHDGQAWWTWRGTIGGGVDRELVLLLPESDISARLQTVTSPLTYGLLLLFGLSVFLLFRLALGWRGRWKRLARAVNRAHAGEAELRELIEKGEGERLEFKSTLRWNLKRNRPGREIELSWLKTVVAFLNSGGGTLLIGVADDGRILGTRADGFPSDDRYLLKVNDLVQKFIGVEFARHLRYELRRLGEESILVMDVMPSSEPAFLRTGDDDLFYVRMGPASRKLNVRRTLEYLRDFGRR